jgi:predicted cobalt transporter CbtA
MIGAYLRRGLAVGLLAGLLAGAVGTLAGEPSIDSAIAIEEARDQAAHTAPASAGGAGGADAEGISRGTQKIGLVLGGMLVGAAAGLVFGLISAWAVGRVGGDGWARSLKLGLAGAGSLVLFPAVKYPPNPPAVGDPDTVATRILLYLGMGLIGVLLVALAWVVARRLAERWRASVPVRQVAVGAGLVIVAAVLAVTMPTVEAPPAPVPAELLWRFRLGSLATQLTLAAAVAVGFGLATLRAEQRATAPGSGAATALTPRSGS